MKETKMFDEILLRRRNKINIGITYVTKVERDNIDRVMIMLRNINALGYTFSKELIEEIRLFPAEVQNDLYKELVSCLKEYRGADKEWNPMYPNFPEQVEQADDWELFINAVVHYLSDGTLIPAYEKDERLPLFESPELTVLDVGTDEDLFEIMNNLIGSKTSLSETDKIDMIWLIKNSGIINNKLPDTIPFKENVAVICKLIMDNTSEIEWYSVLHKYLKTATDILRFVTYLSDGDISLATNTEYKSLPRKQRELILKLLDNAGNIEEDMKRYRIKWIRLGEILHAGEYKKFNNVYTAFDKLRNNGKIETFNGKVKRSFDDGDIEYTFKLLKTRPGEFARRLDYILRRCPQSHKLILDYFKEIASEISVPVLLQVRTHFEHRNKKNDSRVFFPKGQLAKSYTVKNELEDIQKDTCDTIVKICGDAIVYKFNLDVEEGRKESLGKVYIDDSIKGYCVPQSQRSASKSLKNVTRCSHFKIKDDAKFIRLGIHWMNELVHNREVRTDIDLSCSFLDKNFGNMDHISYTHLRNSYSTHSGDFVTAPRESGGSAEFIDINIDEALKSGVKYAAIQIYGYTHTKFCDLDDMVFNWQEGVDAQFGDIFEASRVQQSINLGFDSDCGIPVVFDLGKREVIWHDLSLKTQTYFPKCVEGNIRGVSATVMGICQSHKPTMYDLAVLNAIGRGTEIVEDRNKADTVFDMNTQPPVEIITKHIEVQNEKGEVIDTRIETEEKVKECRIITPFMIDSWMGELL